MTGASPLDGASPSLVVALTVRFLLELALLVGVAVLTWNLSSGWWRWLMAIGAVVAVATLWGLFLSPKAVVALPPGAGRVPRRDRRRRHPSPTDAADADAPHRR